ncbi:hypothetical protein E2C01_020328 [Portunus trituberculatus]|uniref:Uncharacterized protein n=1 Tax=Portunus trituberculatus TaxID=210409 RepID=A0A5B7E2V7_PORTR|nr:hypothetical protein [Portunus trituberculatus]
MILGHPLLLFYTPSASSSCGCSQAATWPLLSEPLMALVIMLAPDVAATCKDGHTCKCGCHTSITILHCQDLQRIHLSTLSDALLTLKASYISLFVIFALFPYPILGFTNKQHEWDVPRCVVWQAGTSSGSGSSSGVLIPQLHAIKVKLSGR